MRNLIPDRRDKSLQAHQDGERIFSLRRLHEIEGVDLVTVLAQICIDLPDNCLAGGMLS